MAHEHLTYDDLLRIVELIKSSERFSEFRLRVGEIEIELRRRGAAGASNPAPVVAAARVESTPDASQITRELPSTAPPANATWPEGSIIVRSPMVGTFYRAPQPGAPPFVRVGQTVEPATTVCIVEVMKLMNSIPAGAHGVVVRILVDDASPVETGQPLIALQPRSESR